MTTPDTAIKAVPIKAVLWDFGGVILTSPFEAFRRYEDSRGLPRDFLRKVNATNPHTNAWARFERGEVDALAFGALFQAEARSEDRRVGEEWVRKCSTRGTQCH